jgi:hypothetical protein
MRVALLVLAIAGTAHAEVCSVDDITTRIERLTGRVVDATTFTVNAEQRGNGFVATVEIGGGTREVSAPSCDAALDAAALVIGMAAPEPSRPVENPATRGIPAHSATPPHPESLSQSEAHPRPSRRSNDLRTIWIAAGVASGGQQMTGFGGDWRRGPALYRVELRATRSAEITVTPVATATIWETSATALMCTHAKGLLTCALATVGLSLGSSDHLDGAHLVALPLLAAGARVEWEYPQDGLLAVRLAAEGAVRATTTHLDVNDMPVWTSRRFEGLASGSVVVRFP